MNLLKWLFMNTFQVDPFWSFLVNLVILSKLGNFLPTWSFLINLIMATSRIFWAKINIFLIYIPKDSPCSCDHFHTKLFVVGGRLRRRNRRKLPKKRNQSHLFCDVINDVSLMSRNLYERWKMFNIRKKIYLNIKRTCATQDL